MKHRCNGFSLIELLIVIAIILIVVAVVLPLVAPLQTQYEIITPQGTFHDTGCSTYYGAIHCDHMQFTGTATVREVPKQ